MHSSCYAGRSCNDWVEKRGYCVDYIKSKIPTFPIPQNSTEIAALKNKEITEVTQGDVAIFNLGNYWHVAYVENVHLDTQGNATAIDVSEMNFGGKMSFGKYKYKWRSKKKSEWKRALSCGVTDKYYQTSMRENIALNTVTQIWSPTPAASESAGERQGNAVFNRVKEVLNQFFLFAEREL
jgi:hypothetical protein